MKASSRDWVRLGAAMRIQRLRLGLKQKDVAAAAGLTTRTLINYEKGRPLGEGEAVPGGYYRIEPVIGWAPGSVDAVLDGREPTLKSLESDANSGRNTSGITSEALALYPYVTSFGQLCVAAGGNAEERTAFDEAATRLLQSVPGYAALGASGLRRADVALAAMRPHGEGEPPPLDDVLRAIRAAEAGESNTDL